MYQYLQLVEDEQNENFFSDIYNDYRDEMFYTAFEILHNRQDAEDVVHETFVVLLDNLEKMEENPPKKNRNYILTIVKNKSYNLLKQQKYQSGRELVEEMLEEVFDEEMDRKIILLEQTEVLSDALRRMKKSYRDILLLQYYHEMSIPQIAKLLGKTPDNVRHMSMRAKKKLKKTFKESLHRMARRKRKEEKIIQRKMVG